MVEIGPYLFQPPYNEYEDFHDYGYLCVLQCVSYHNKIEHTLV